MEIGVMLGCLVVIISILYSAIVRWNELRYKRKGLPPGTMGLPIFGETIDFMKRGPEFMKDRRKRYGSLFKTHFLGSPVVVSMDPDTNKYISLSEKEGIVPGYPLSMVDILGPSSISAVYGDPHKILRGALLAVINTTSIKTSILPNIDGFISSHLSTWGRKVIDIQMKTKEMAILSAFRNITSLDVNGPQATIYKEEFYNIYMGALALRFNLPGTNYHRGLKGREKTIILVKEVLKQRRASRQIYNDMLESLMHHIETTRPDFTEEQLIDTIFTLTYSGIETFSTTCMMATKFLQEHPKALQQLREEHMEIRKRKAPGEGLTWDDYKSMVFTRAVINETLRYGTVVNGAMRRTVRDVELNGYIIPKGWRIYVYAREGNYDPTLYPEPFTFNPWRWQDGSLERNRLYMMFGEGARACVGKELALVEITTFLHYFCTRYSWEFVGGEKLEVFPRTFAPNGLHVKVSHLSEACTY